MAISESVKNRPVPFVWFNMSLIQFCCLVIVLLLPVPAFSEYVGCQQHVFCQAALPYPTTCKYEEGVTYNGSIENVTSGTCGGFVSNQTYSCRNGIWYNMPPTTQYVAWQVFNTTSISPAFTDTSLRIFTAASPCVWQCGSVTMDCSSCIGTSNGLVNTSVACSSSSPSVTTVCGGKNIIEVGNGIWRCSLCTNGETKACLYTGPSGTENKGICKAGTQTCVNGQWGVCAGEVTPQLEICDGKDNNCDGQIDEGFDVGAACSVGVGACKRDGVKVCSANGTGTVCSATPGTPSPEICGDSLDNNCDGQVDEGCVICEDKDGDGHYAISPSCPQGDDCNDNDPSINPATVWYKDFDGDKYSDGTTFTGCNQPNGYYLSKDLKSVSGDCNDSDGEINPEAIEKCDTIDNNCDWQVDETCLGGSCSNISLGSTANPASGNLYHNQTLFNTNTPGLTLSYNSIDNFGSPLGKGWTHNYNLLLFGGHDGSLGLKQGDGRIVYFRLDNGIYYPDANSGEDSYISYNNGAYTLTEKDSTTYNFNTSGKLISIRDRNGNTTTLTYTGNHESSSGQALTTITDPSGRTIYLTYDSQNRISAVTGTNNNVYNFTYANDTLISVSFSLVGNPSGWSYSYDSNGQMQAKTDPQGYVTTYTYDSEGRVTSSIDPEGKTKRISYDSANNTAIVTEKDGGVWIYRYDPLLNVTTQKIDPLGNVTTYQYDSYKNLLSTREPDGSITSYTYDEYGNMASVTDPTGNTTSYAYNEYGQITSVTDSEGNVTRYEYDSNGNQTAVIDPTGAKTQYQYDSKGNLTKVTNPLGQATTFTYDQYNNMTSVTDPQGKTTRYAYDSAGNMIAMMDSSGNTTEYFYDSLARLIKLIEPGGAITYYTYDASGNRTSVTDGNLNVIQYAYNYKDQLMKVLDPLSGITAYEYGGTGCATCSSGSDKLTAIIDAEGNRTSFEHDLLGRLIKEADSLGKIISYAYDSKSNLISVVSDKN